MAPRSWAHEPRSASKASRGVGGRWQGAAINSSDASIHHELLQGRTDIKVPDCFERLFCRSPEWKGAPQGLCAETR